MALPLAEQLANVTLTLTHPCSETDTSMSKDGQNCSRDAVRMGSSAEVRYRVGLLHELLGRLLHLPQECPQHAPLR